jgi:hypothetical protein
MMIGDGGRDDHAMRLAWRSRGGWHGLFPILGVSPFVRFCALHNFSCNARRPGLFQDYAAMQQYPHQAP